MDAIDTIDRGRSWTPWPCSSRLLFADAFQYISDRRHPTSGLRLSNPLPVEPLLVIVLFVSNEHRFSLLFSSLIARTSRVSSLRRSPVRQTDLTIDAGVRAYLALNPIPPEAKRERHTISRYHELALPLAIVPFSVR